MGIGLPTGLDERTKSRSGGPCSFQGLTSRDGRSLTGIGRAVTDSRRLEHGSDTFTGKPDRPPWKGPSWEGQGLGMTI
jgi:hypothetical protein